MEIDSMRVVCSIMNINTVIEEINKCKKLSKDQKTDWTIQLDHSLQWLGYDPMELVIKKAEYEESH